jgi:hypothetical protein
MKLTKKQLKKLIQEGLLGSVGDVVAHKADARKRLGGIGPVEPAWSPEEEDEPGGFSPSSRSHSDIDIEAQVLAGPVVKAISKFCNENGSKLGHPYGSQLLLETIIRMLEEKV